MPVDLFVLDSTFSLLVLRMTSEGKFVLHKTIKVGPNDMLRKMAETLKPFENVSLSERTIGIRNKAFLVETGAEFCPFSDEELRNDDDLGGNAELTLINEPFGNSIVY